MRFGSVIALLVFTLASCQTTGPNTISLHIEGYVLDQFGAPVVGLPVVLADYRGQGDPGVALGTGVTDARGFYALIGSNHRPGYSVDSNCSKMVLTLYFGSSGWFLLPSTDVSCTSAIQRIDLTVQRTFSR